ncbi:MAG TPA: 16S rRNA (guanine(527)-N(7))-methyltransferase RsmG [Steroidobacteraceae bacterium]|nr:16S rRNA (guanine(527)-N(7))-methyltransferase RsmG [Steroidobacteraceae bacterium]
MAEVSAALARGAARLGVALDEAQQSQLLRLAAELLRWNKAYNLTAITAPEAVLTHHLLDSLAVAPDLAGTSVADVGTGAGFPGLPLAIAQPARQFTLIDAVDKKLRFVDHMIRELGLANARTLHARVETLRPGHGSTALPATFDTVIARAFAPLPRLLQLVAPLCGAHTRVLAMVGRWPPADAAEAAIPAQWRLVSERPIEVPGLGAERHILCLMQSATTPPGR